MSVDQAKLLASLSPEKRKLLERKLAAGAFGTFPVSFSQQRLWFLQQLEPESSLYNIPLVTRFRGALDATALERAVQTVMQRHEVLRTGFIAVNGTPFQKVHKELGFTLPIVDMSAEAEVERRLRDFAVQEWRKPFDLAKPPLFRAALLKLSASEHVLVIILHHIITDGWSNGILLREVAALYTAFVQQKSSPLPPLEFQYAEYANWQRKFLSGEQFEAQLAFWNEQLAQAPPHLDLPTDRPRPAFQSNRGADHVFDFPDELAQRIKAFCTAQGTTLFMTLLAAFQLLLHRYSGQERISVGTPIANRTKKQFENLIGFFVNTLVMHTDLSGNPSFRELVQRVKAATLGAYAHQDMPFERLVEALQPERDPSYTPLFQVMFVLQNKAAGALSLPGVEVSAVELPKEASTFDLTLGVAETETGLVGSIEYNTDLFEESTVARLAEHLIRLIDFALRAPETPIEAIPLIDAAERRRIVSEWNHTDRDFEHDGCVHQLIEAQIERTPEAIAVIGRSERLTFRQLNARANQLAHLLMAQGVGADDVVAVSMPRSPEMIVSLLAVLKTGAAYLPLDPDYPSERLAFMLQDARVQAVVTQENRLPALPIDLPRIMVNDPRLEDAPTTNPNAPVDPLNIAYIIYTSGSTGTPKGVMVPHRAVVNHHLAAIADYQLTAGDRVLQFSSINFDAAVEEIFPTLMCGAALVLRDAAPVQTVAEILQLAEAEAVTVLDFPTAYWHQAVQELNAGLKLPASVRICLIGGEKASLERFAVWQRVAAGVRLVNTYGPTETTIVSTVFAPRADFDPSRRATLPIGRPIRNVYNYVLDRQLNPVPVGVAGELYTGGKGVTRGYLNRPDLTAAVFVPDPFSRRPGALMYKTGDLVRLTADGAVEYLGRVDFQVKVRGFRIELGEIEGALLQHPNVRECAVAARPVNAVDNELIAFVGGADVVESELRAFLKERLPGYMMPAQFVIRPALPKTAGGKIDKRALPIPEIRDTHVAKTPPRTPSEEKLAQLFADLLRVSAVGVEDDFFQLGGHSLIATQLASRVRDAFGVELPLRELFVEPTVAHLARIIDEMILAQTGNGRPPILPAPAGVEKPLSFAQQRMWFLDQLEPGSAQYNIPDAVRIRGRLDAEVLRRVLQTIVQRHEVLRTAFPTAEGKPRLEVLPTLEVQLPLIDLSPLPAKERERQLAQRITETAQQGFDLSRAPLFRLRLIRLADDDHVLASAMHHIISDGWSFAVLVSETATLYGRMLRGDSTPLPPLTIQYSDFALWQRNRLQGEVLEKELDFWRRQLEGAPVLSLPTDRPRPAFMTTNGAHLAFSLSETATRALNDLCRKQGVTPFMALLAAFKVFLYRYSRQTSISVGSPIANRTGRELESLIGFFVNTLVLRTDLSGAPSFLELLKRVQETTVDAFAHQDVPFEKIVDALQPERDTGHSPLFQVMFLLQNIPSQGQGIEGLHFESLPIETRTANFDLTLVLEEQEGRLLGGFEYNTDLFNESTVRRMARHFSALVEGLVAAPEQTIDRLNMLSADENFQVLFGWNDTAVDYGAGVIHELISQQARKTPEAVAVKMAERTLTYGEQEARANRLAHHLIARGVQSEEIVGICLERSPEMMVALLGILKTGAAYLPLDPAYPPERIRYMIEDARVRVVLTQERLQAIFGGLNVETLNLDRDWPGDGEPNPPSVAVSPLNLAYVIYTSGSTGLPKGVLVTHQGVVNHNNVIRHEYGYSAADRVLQFFSLNFDGAVEEIFPTLMSGATLVLRPEGRVLAIDELLALAEQERLTVLDIPTAYWHELAFELDQYRKKLPESVRLVLTGGEAASPERYELWQKNVGGNVQWLNTYGPTEGTVIASVYDPAADPNRDPATMPIGKPLSNDKLYIIDPQLNPSPVGVPGELCIGGVGVARGYLNRADLTAEKFIPDPFSGVEGARLYRTGDLALWREDGNVMFIGRADDQVKVRGFRIELGEIEAALLRFAGIREAAAAARRDGGQDLKLAAYVVTESGRIDPDELRAFLKEQLPDYMMPHAIVPLAALPRLISGKIDRRSLPKPEFVAGDAAAFEEPVGANEQKLAAIFREILGGERIGRHDNFFERGGDSIMSIQVIAKAAQAGIRLTPKQLFEAPTPAGLAELAGKGVATVAEQETLVGEVALSPIQKWFFEQRFDAPHHWNQSLLFAVGQPLDVEALQRALAKIVEHHDALRLRFSPAGDRAFFVERETNEVLKTYDLRTLAPAERRSFVETECARLQASFELQNGPLFVAGYFDLGDEARLFLAAHHLVIDGVSWRILLEDIQSAYGQAAAGAEIRLPEKTTGWRYWTSKLNEYARSTAVQSELDYWTHYERQLAARLPVDFADGAEENFEETAERVSVELSAEQTRQLLQEVLAGEKVQINDVLLAALTQALAAWSGQRAFLVEMEGHGREPLFEEVNLTRTVGWFTTIFPLFVKSERGASAKETMRSISAMFDQLPKRGIGYGLLRYAADASDVRTKLAGMPEAEIGFNYLGQFDQLMTEGSPFRPAAESKGAERSPNARRTHLLEVTAVVTGGRLRIEWEYSRRVHRLETIQELASHFKSALEKIIEGGDSAGGKNSSKIDQRQLGKILGQLNKGKGKSA